MEAHMKAVVLLSGGLDSTTTAFVARRDGFDLYPLTIQYGQRHARELQAARDVCAHLGEIEEHRIATVDLGGSWGSSLTGDGDIPVTGLDDAIPSTWVPMRNLIFLGLAAGYAEVIDAQAIYIGVGQVDYSGYPDCRQEFIDAFQHAANQASKQYVEDGIAIPVVAPLMNLSKPEIIRLGRQLGVDYDLTWSCYEGGEAPCGVCDSCRLRDAAFAEVDG